MEDVPDYPLAMLNPSLTTRLRNSAPKGRGAFSRLFAGLWMVLYLGVVAVAPVADGLMDHHDQTVLHVEDADGGHCPPSHDGEACDMCQLAHGLRALAVPPLAEISRLTDAGHAATAARGIAATELSFLDGRSSRAPPLG